MRVGDNMSSETQLMMSLGERGWLNASCLFFSRPWHCVSVIIVSVISSVFVISSAWSIIPYHSHGDNVKEICFSSIKKYKFQHPKILLILERNTNHRKKSSVRVCLSSWLEVFSQCPLSEGKFSGNVVPMIDDGDWRF